MIQTLDDPHAADRRVEFHKVAWKVKRIERDGLKTVTVTFTNKNTSVTIADISVYDARRFADAIRRVLDDDDVTSTVCYP